MKKEKNSVESLIDAIQKPNEQTTRKKPNKQFELLYRQRDQSAQENPIESIIFVKSKHCRPNQTNKKIKVQEEFAKIMNDLNAHLNQHKKQKSLKIAQKVSHSTTASQLKGTLIAKKQTKQSESVTKKSKKTQRQQHKHFKVVNKQNSNFAKQIVQNVSECKSPKKANKQYLSPKSKNVQSPKAKNLVSPKVLKTQKQNLEGKVFSFQELERRKSPKQKTKRKQHKNEILIGQDMSKTKTRQNIVSSQQRNNWSTINKGQAKRNIRSIPLKVQEYILIEDNFELIKHKNLCKLQTKLISTFRGNLKQIQNRLPFKTNHSTDKEAYFQKINSPAFDQKYINFKERSQDSHSESEQQANSNKSQNQSVDTNRNGIRRAMQDERRIFFEKLVLKQKTILLQKWWRKILQKSKIQQQMQKDIQQEISEIYQNKKNKRQTIKNQTQAIVLVQSVDLPSVQSIQFSPEIEFSPQGELSQQGEFKPQGEFRQKLQNKGRDKLHQQYKEAEFKIISDKKRVQNSQEYQEDQFGSCKKQFASDQQNDENESPSPLEQNSPYLPRLEQNLDQQGDEVEIKICKVGDKITSQMQQFIQSKKKQQESNKTLIETQANKQVDIIQQRYKKRTNELGEQYYEDFDSEQSIQSSPHKMLDPHNFEDFQSHIDGQHHGAFEPNTHFITMLEQFKQQQQLKAHIDRRVNIQMGAIKSENSLQPNMTVDTSILGIHQFLVNFFKFYLYYYKDEFIRFVNTPYGYQPEKRLKFMQGYDDTSDQLSQDSDGIIYGLQFIISDDVFDQFIEQYYGLALQNASQQRKNQIEFSKIHDRALFQTFNEALNHFRPYYSINGPPYIWNSSEKTMSFYFIAEENIQQVFEKTQFRILKWASSLIGLIVEKYETCGNHSKKSPNNKQGETQSDLQSIMACYQSKCHPTIIQSRQQRLMKQQKEELIENMSKWNHLQEHTTSILFEVSSLILQELSREILGQLLGLP